MQTAEDDILIHDSDSELRIRKFREGAFEVQEYRDAMALPGMFTASQGWWSRIATFPEIDSAFNYMERLATIRKQSLRIVLNQAWKKVRDTVWENTFTDD